MLRYYREESAVSANCDVIGWIIRITEKSDGCRWLTLLTSIQSDDVVELADYNRADARNPRTAETRPLTDLNLCTSVTNKKMTLKNVKMYGKTMSLCIASAARK